MGELATDVPRKGAGATSGGLCLLLLCPGTREPRLPISTCGCVQLIDKINQQLGYSVTHDGGVRAPAKRGWVRGGEEALEMVISEVVFEAVSVRQVNASPGGRRGKRNVY